jgi:hypothetical protein
MGKIKGISLITLLCHNIERSAHLFELHAGDLATLEYYSRVENKEGFHV